MRIVRIEVPIAPPSEGPPRAGHPRGTANAWLLPDPPVTLVDCGPDLPAAGEAIARGIRSVGLPLSRLEQILVTHWHPDHAGGAGRLAEATGARIYAHAADLPSIRDPAAQRAVRWRGIERALLEAGASTADAESVRARFDGFAPLSSPAPKARAYEGTVVDAGGAILEILHVPGHTAGHVALHAVREKVLFTGDALLKVIAANANALDPRDRDSLSLQLASLERLLGLPPVAVHPGHGAPFQDHGQVIGRDLAHHARRGDKVLMLLATGPRSARGIVDGLFLGRVDVHFALSEVFAHLALLANHGDARAEPKSGDATVWTLTDAGKKRAAEAAEEAREGAA